MNKIYIVAGRYEQFVHWCRKNAVSPNSQLIKYVDSEEALEGIVNPSVVFVGNYRNRPDISRLLDIIKEQTYHYPLCDDNYCTHYLRNKDCVYFAGEVVCGDKEACAVVPRVEKRITERRKGFMGDSGSMVYAVNCVFVHLRNGGRYVIKGAWDGRHPDDGVCFLMRADGTGHAYASRVTPVKNVWNISAVEFDDMCGGRPEWLRPVEVKVEEIEEPERSSQGDKKPMSSVVAAGVAAKDRTELEVRLEEIIEEVTAQISAQHIKLEYKGCWEILDDLILSLKRLLHEEV